MEQPKTNHSVYRNYLSNTTKPSKSWATEPSISLPKKILFFFLALIPAALLAYLLIYWAYKLDLQQKKADELYNLYQQNQLDYSQYQEKLREMQTLDDKSKKDMWGSLLKMNQEMENQRELLKMQQEQLKQEQQRIQTLLKQNRNR